MLVTNPNIGITTCFWVIPMSWTILTYGTLNRSSRVTRPVL